MSELGKHESILHVEGVLDIRLARRVAEYLEAASAWSRIRVDMSKVTEFQDFGIAILAQALKHMRWARITIVGLRAPQLRVFQHFGMDPAALSQARASDADPARA